MNFNPQEAIARAFGYVHIDEDEKLLIKDNTEYYCKACGKLHSIGLLDKKNTILGVKYNGFYSFEDVNSPFICEYCYFNFKNYKKSMRVSNIQNEHLSKLKILDENTIKVSMDYIKKEYFELLNNAVIKLEKSQEKKAKSFSELSYCYGDVVKAIKDCFNYEILVEFTKKQGLNDIASKYEEANDMANCIIYKENDKYIFKVLDLTRGSEDNGLYDIIKKPPRNPFVLLSKDVKGSTFVESMHTAIETVDESVIVLNHGYKNYEVKRDKVFDCIDEANEILKKYRKKKLNISEDLLYNSVLDKEYSKYFHLEIRNDNEFMKEFESFINKYDYATRFVAKTIFKTYMKKGR